MKSKSYKNRDEKQNVWDAFVNHLDQLYFPGAEDFLDRQTLAFEYEAYIHDFAQGQ
jgi:hypothetical protein